MTSSIRKLRKEISSLSGAYFGSLVAYAKKRATPLRTASGASTNESARMLVVNAKAGHVDACVCYAISLSPVQLSFASSLVCCASEDSPKDLVTCL